MSRCGQIVWGGGGGGDGEWEHIYIYIYTYMYIIHIHAYIVPLMILRLFHNMLQNAVFFSTTPTFAYLLEQGSTEAQRT